MVRRAHYGKMFHTELDPARLLCGTAQADIIGNMLP